MKDVLGWQWPPHLVRWPTLARGPAPARAAPKTDAPADAAPAPADARPFNLLRWFAIASLAAVLPVAALTGSILSHFVTGRALTRGASLTAQFVRSVVEVEGEHIGIGGLGLAPLLDPRVDPASRGLPAEAVVAARQRVLGHIRRLPDLLLANLHARDGRIVWSTNPALIGTASADTLQIHEAFAYRKEVARYHDADEPRLHEPRFARKPVSFYLENEFPILDAAGAPVLVLEVYKEPPRLLGDLRRGELLVWATTIGGGLAIYLVLFSIMRRAAVLLAQQERQLAEAESLVYLGEMSTALAHSLRNPLANIRTSAELALDAQEAPVRKNAQDIITQVDFVTKWVRELLLFSRPLAPEKEPVNLCTTLHGLLDSFAPALERSAIKVTWQPDAVARPLVRGNATLIMQALHSVISNAVEAMPGGGELRIVLRTTDAPPGVEVIVSDTGVGMSPQQVAGAFRAFHTSKAHGLGVGLPMMKRAMERFGGVVTLSSAQNAGTQVRLRFRT